LASCGASSFVVVVEVALADGDDQASEHLANAYRGFQEALDVCDAAKTNVEANDALKFELAALA
jgi:hypothetical protein